MGNEQRAPTTVLAGIGVVGAAVMVLQIAVTRLLSATVSYHSAFAVIALVMLGLAASATSVFLRRQGPAGAGIDVAAGMLTKAAGLSAVGMLAFVWIGILPLGGLMRAVQMLGAGLLFFQVFWFTGWAVAWLLAEFHEDVGRVYWFDLTGAAVGCLLAVPLLDLTSAMNVILACGAGFGLAGLLLAPPDRRSVSAGVFGAVALLALAGTLFPPITQLRHAKGQDQVNMHTVRWNHLARVTVSDHIPDVQRAIDYLKARDPDLDPMPIVNRWQMGWGMSDRYTGEAPEILWVQLDGDAGTQIIRDGVGRVGRDLPFLEADVTSAAHHLKKGDLDDVFVIGGGGGRDILAALHFGAERVRVVELNKDVVRAVDRDFRDFSGGTYSHPKVDLSIGEARSVLSREEDRFDLIQMSMIDTWASSMAGSMVLSENGLYTAEAFELFVQHLDDDGMLSVSRWYHPIRWGELARVVSVAASALGSVGIDDPAQHIAVVYARGSFDLNVGTVVVKRSPFTTAEREQMSAWAASMGFFELWPRDPSVEGEIDLDAVLRGDLAGSPFDLAPATDDRPFFFNVDAPFRSWVRAIQVGDPTLGSQSTLIIVALLALVALASRLIVFAPLAEHEARKPESERTQLRDQLRPLAYFAGIGFGFMWVELAVIQRYITFLGHPTYALSVVLFALLLFGGLGSMLSERVGWKVAVAAILVGVLVTAFGVPFVTEATYGLPKVGRILIAVALIAPLALVMGMMYPSGVRLLERAGLADLVPWVWAINGVAGVFASVAGMFLAVNYGYTVVLLLGALAYGVTAWAASAPFSGRVPVAPE